MRILIINTYEKQGGAARATGRLFNGLKDLGNDVNMMVQNRDSDDPDILTTGGLISRKINFLWPYIDFAIPLPMVRKRILFSTALLPDQLIRSIGKIKPDIVHLNWIAGGMIRIESLATIEQPIVWTFHDLWAITGGCHNPLDCIRYHETCGRCPILHSDRENDLSRKVFFRKKAAYSKIKNLSVVTPSKWLANCVKSGSLLNDRPVEVIPNGLDTSLFKPAGKTEARRRFNLPSDKKIILFGGIRGVEYRLKGFHLLIAALKLVGRHDIELIVFGSSHSRLAESIPFKTHFLGPVRNEKDLPAIYNAADLAVVPSYQEVFGQTASEALSCGVPVVAFATSGLLDIVDHQVNGYLAKPFETDDLAYGINWILGKESRYQALTQAARLKAKTHFDIRKVAVQYTELYHKILNTESAG